MSATMRSCRTLVHSSGSVRVPSALIRRRVPTNNAAAPSSSMPSLANTSLSSRDVRHDASEHSLPSSPLNRRLFSSASPLSTSTASTHYAETNPLLDAVKTTGLSSLTATTTNLPANVRKPLFASLEEEAGPTVDQLREANRIERTLLESLARYSERSNTFTIRGESIDITDVEVSPDLRQARAFWTLPYSLLADNRLPRSTLREVGVRMQKVLDGKGQRLQAMVHSTLRAYYPPKISFVPADEGLVEAVKETDFLEGGDRRKRRK